MKAPHDVGSIDIAVMNMMDNLGDGFHIHNTYDERYVAIFPPEHQLGTLNAIKLSNLSGEPYVDRLAYEMREMAGDVCKYKGTELYARFRSERETDCRR